MGRRLARWCLLLAACSAVACAMKAKPARPAGFIEQESLSKPADLPFHRAWLKPETDLQRYTAIYVAPINTDHLLEASVWKQLGRRGHMEEDARKLAVYAQQELHTALRRDRTHRFTVVDDPQQLGPEGLVLEAALVELIPSKVLLNAIGYVPFVGSGVKVLKMLSGRSSIAFEARLRDAASGEVIALFADRETEKWAPLNLQDLTLYGHTKGIIRDWSKQFVRVLSRRPGEIVKDSSFFTLKPW